MRRFHYASGGIFDIAVSPNEMRIAIAGPKDGIVLFDVQTGEPLVNLDVKAETVNVEFSGDGQTLYSAHRDGLIRIWDGTYDRQDTLDPLRANDRD